MTAASASSITVLGAGSWGTALAVLLASNGVATALWGRNPERMGRMAAARCNERYLPGVGFPEHLAVEPDLARALAAADDLLLAVPAAAFREVLRALAPHRASDQRVAWATKGLEAGSHKLLHEVVAEELGGGVPRAVLSGPTFAREVAAGLPTAVTVAADPPAFAEQLAAALHSESFRVYTGTDLVGVQLGGAVKNVLAIAAGASDGLGFGANARAALITRGLSELMRLGEAAGGRRETFMGLAGLGDLVLTCTDDQSRNRRAGLLLARGLSLAQTLERIGQVVEGVPAAREVMALAQEAGVELPIAEQTYRVLYEGIAPRDAVRALLSREQKAER
ncbi:MAG: NAD(P)-dependent glycerol-3-phosphate dehydrogenase [Gammaproteobacteria bacterium]|nr:NAD(P)-dependent glycerol-3-phosphate dehydrogenase [Gammaproteobacteria bacterium]